MKGNDIVLALLSLGVAISFILPLGPAFASPLHRASAFSHRAFTKPSAAEIHNAMQHAGHSAKRDDAQYTIIDDPNEGYYAGQGTFAFGLNASGAVVGYYNDGETHGYERSSDGMYQTIEVGKTGSYAIAINNQGAVAGFDGDLKKRCTGFVLTPKRKLKRFEPTDGKRGGCYIDVYAINNGTSIVGDYEAVDGLWHGYQRDKSGAFTVFDVPGAVGTFATGVNDSGTIVGIYADGSRYHGYVRNADGTFTIFDAPGGPGDGDIAARINNLGEVQGDYVDDNGVSHGLIREPDGSIAVYDAPDAGKGAEQGTVGFGHINNSGTAAGYYWDANNIPHGYVRTSDGVITEFDPPGSIWTIAADIDDNGVVTGTYMDQYANFHGFLRTP